MDDIDRCGMHECNNRRSYGRLYCADCWAKVQKQSKEVDDGGLAEIQAEEDAGV